MGGGRCYQASKSIAVGRNRCLEDNSLTPSFRNGHITYAYQSKGEFGRNAATVRLAQKTDSDAVYLEFRGYLPLDLIAEDKKL